jgi:hypothetical protein
LFLGEWLLIAKNPKLKRGQQKSLIRLYYSLLSNILSGTRHRTWKSIFTSICLQFQSLLVDLGQTLTPRYLNMASMIAGPSRRPAQLVSTRSFPQLSARCYTQTAVNYDATNQQPSPVINKKPRYRKRKPTMMMQPAGRSIPIPMPQKSRSLPFKKMQARRGPMPSALPLRNMPNGPPPTAIPAVQEVASSTQQPHSPKAVRHEPPAHLQPGPMAWSRPRASATFETGRTNAKASTSSSGGQTKVSGASEHLYQRQGSH